MEHKPNEIKEYYIAYFDILGYQAFFKETPEKANEFLETVDSVISNTLYTVKRANNSQLASQYANLNIQYRIFSDNILLCIEVGNDNVIEKARLIAFMSIISTIQRGFIADYGLFVRGGFTMGNLSINENYIFGEGLIEAVNIEERTFHPRIAVSDKIINRLDSLQICSKNEFDRAVLIEKRLNTSEDVTEEEKNFYYKILNLNNQMNQEFTITSNQLYRCNDDIWCLSYLYCFDIRSFASEQAIDRMLEMARKLLPDDYHNLSNSVQNIDAILDAHKHFIEKNLIKYSDYSSIVTNNLQEFETQERVLKKYVWTMVYHNDMCYKYNKPEYKIVSQGNCERKHMKLVIHVYDKNGNLLNQ